MEISRLRRDYQILSVVKMLDVLISVADVVVACKRCAASLAIDIVKRSRMTLCYCRLHSPIEHLFHKMVNNKDHCIHQLLPPEKILPMKLGATNCIFALPQCHYKLYKRSFVLRYLFSNAY